MASWMGRRRDNVLRGRGKRDGVVGRGGGGGGGGVGGGGGGGGGIVSQGEGGGRGGGGGGMVSQGGGGGDGVVGGEGEREVREGEEEQFPRGRQRGGGGGRGWGGRRRRRMKTKGSGRRRGGVPERRRMESWKGRRTARREEEGLVFQEESGAEGGVLGRRTETVLARGRPSGPQPSGPQPGRSPCPVSRRPRHLPRTRPLASPLPFRQEPRPYHVPQFATVIGSPWHEGRGDEGQCGDDRA